MNRNYFKLVKIYQNHYFLNIWHLSISLDRELIEDNFQMNYLHKLFTTFNEPEKKLE